VAVVVEPVTAQEQLKVAMVVSTELVVAVAHLPPFLLAALVLRELSSSITPL
jgi:hypothetical protein